MRESAEERQMDGKTPMSPLAYVSRSGAATLGELTNLKKVDPAGFDKVREWAKDEMRFVGQPISGE